MEMFKELLILCKMFFTKVELGLKALPILKMQHFPLNGYAAMQWCGHIIDKAGDDVSIDDTIMCHEMVHYKQACTFGVWWKYYLAYLWEWLRLGWWAYSIYYVHPMEIEACIHEVNPNYETYRGKYKMYRMKHARRIFRENMYNWIPFIREKFKNDVTIEKERE